MKSYTEEFRHEAVELARSSGKPVSQVAKELGLATSTLFGWTRRFAMTVDSPQGHAVDLETENKRLRKENQVLQMERDILKKATAFFAKENR